MRGVGEQALLPLICDRGMDQSVSDRNAPTGTFKLVQNMRVKNSLLEKRYGTRAIDCSSSKVTSTGQAVMLGDGSDYYVEKPALLATVGNAPVVGTTNGILWAADDANSETGVEPYPFYFSTLGKFSTVKPLRSRSNISYTLFSTVQAACAVNSDNYQCVAWAEADDNTGYGVRVVITNPNGVRVFTDINTHPANQPTRLVVIAQGRNFRLLYDDSTSLDGVVYGNTGGSWGRTAFSSLVTLGTSKSFDAVAITSTTWALVFSQADDTGWTVNQYTNATLDNTASSGSASEATDTARGVTISLIDRVSGADYLAVGIYEARTAGAGGGYQVRVESFTTALAAGPITAKNLLTSSDNFYGPPLMGTAHATQIQNGAVAYVYRHVTATHYGARPGTLQTDGSDSPAGIVWGILPVSKPDNYGRFWVATADEPVTAREGGTYRYLLIRRATQTYWIEASSPAFVADSIFQGLVTLRGDRFGAPSVSSDRADVILPCNLGPVVDMREFVYETLELSPHVFSSPSHPGLVTGGQVTEHWGFPLGPSHASGIVNDGGGSAECGFPQVPIIISATATAGTGSAGTRSYRAVWEWVDIYGRRHQSQPSLAVSCTVTANQSVQIVVTVPTIGQRSEASADKSRRPVVSIYSTVDGGTEYLLMSTTATGNGDVGTSGTITVTVNTVDDTIAGGSVLYTDGGVLPHSIGPAAKYVVRTEERVWCAGLWDEVMLQCSKIIIPTEPVQFADNDAFRVPLSAPCTGLATMDGAVIAFTASAIYVISGEGPNDQGIGAFGAPALVSGTVGCIDARSIVRTDNGIIFRARQGFYMLPRGLGSPVFIGAQVRGDSASYPETLGATVFQDENYYLARFLVAAEDETSSAIVLTYDLVHGHWYRDNLTKELSEIGAWPTGVAFMVEDLDSDNTTNAILLEDQASIGDAGGPDTSSGSYVVQRLDTTTLYPFGPAGSGWVRKCQIELEGIAASTSVTLSVQTDEQTAYSITRSIASADVVSYMEVDLTLPKCTTCRVSIYDAGSEGAAVRGVRFVSVVLETQSDNGIRMLRTATEKE